MIDPISFLIFIVLTVGLSQLVRPRDRVVRLFWLVTPGALLLFITHPNALWLALASFAISSLIYAVGRRFASQRLRARLPYLILLLLFVPDLVGLGIDRPILWLGSAFFIVRQMMTVAQATKRDVPLEAFVPSLLIATFFFAALPSGPVFSGVKVWDELGKQRPAENGPGIYRLFEGFVYLFALSGFANGVLDALADWSTAGVSTVLVTVIWRPLASFAFLFCTFYGYSRMAEGTALLFGFEVPQNFNRPHLARDLSDYWKRWHRSMAEFVMQYIYLPLLVTTKQTKVALIGAFVFMGLWHNMSAAFFIWGVGHGFGLGVAMPWVKRRGVSAALIRAGSLAWVVALSSVAHRVWFA